MDGFAVGCRQTPFLYQPDEQGLAFVLEDLIPYRRADA